MDLAVPQGAIVGLVGPSGAGKTTAMRVGLGLLAPDAGTARVFSTPASEVARHAGRIGLVLDGPALERGLTVAQNLELHALRHGVAQPDATAILARLQLSGLLERRTGRLSQGEQQRVALARALLLAPDLLVLDEPLAHLDPALAQASLGLLEEAVEQRGAAVLLSSHQLAELERVATHLVLLHRGEVLLSGELQTLLRTIATAVRIVARPLDRAHALLAGHGAVSKVTLERVEGVELLRAELKGDSAGAVNAALHAAGIEVSLLAPDRPSLAELFRRTLLAAARPPSPTAVVA